MAYISNSRQRIADIIQGTIARDTKSPEGSGASKPFNKNHPAHPDYVNPKNRKKLRNAGQDEFPMDEGGQFRLPLAKRGLRNLQRAGEDQQAGQRNFDPQRPLSFAENVPQIAGMYTSTTSGNPLSIMGAIQQTMIPEDDNNRIIPENPGRPMMISGIYSSNKSGDTDEVWDVQREIGPQTPFRAGPTSEKFYQKIQELKSKYKYLQGV